MLEHTHLRTARSTRFVEPAIADAAHIPLTGDTVKVAVPVILVGRPDNPGGAVRCAAAIPLMAILHRVSCLAHVHPYGNDVA